MRTALPGSFLTALLAFAPSVSACDEAAYALALRAERDHAAGAAIAPRTRLLACPTSDSAITNQLALARDYAALGDFARAAEFVEALAVAVARSAPVVEAMHEAVGYRLALGEPIRARDGVARLMGGATPDETTVAQALEVGRSFEAARMWTEAALWYDRLARYRSWRIEVPARVGLGRAYEALGDLASAARSWEAVLARWSEARRVLHPACRNLTFGRIHYPSLPRTRPRSSGGPGMVSPFHASRVTESTAGPDNFPSGMAVVPLCDDPRVEDFAEARFRLGWQRARALARGEVPNYPGPERVASYERWIDHVLMPWIEHRFHGVNALGEALGPIANASASRWKIPALAILSDAYLQFATVVRNVRPPPFIECLNVASDAYGPCF